MKALVIVALCVLGLWGICKGVESTLSGSQRQQVDKTIKKGNKPMRKAYDAASGAVDKAFKRPLEWTEKKWPKTFADFMKSIGG